MAIGAICSIILRTITQTCSLRHCFVGQIVQTGHGGNPWKHLGIFGMSITFVGICQLHECQTVHANCSTRITGASGLATTKWWYRQYWITMECAWRILAVKESSYTRKTGLGSMRTHPETENWPREHLFARRPSRNCRCSWICSTTPSNNYVMLPTQIKSWKKLSFFYRDYIAQEHPFYTKYWRVIRR